MNRRLRALSSEQWQAELTKPNVLHRWAVQLISRPGETLDFGEPLAQALRTVVDVVIGGTTFPESLISSWFALANTLSVVSREVLFKDIRDKIISSDAISGVSILRSGSFSLLHEGQFGSESDKCVRHIVMPLLEQDSGRNWLLDVAGEISGWISKADLGTRRYVSERLSDLEQNEDETRHGFAVKVRSLWKLEQSPVIPSGGVEDNKPAA